MYVLLLLCLLLSPLAQSRAQSLYVQCNQQHYFPGEPLQFNALWMGDSSVQLLRLQVINAQAQVCGQGFYAFREKSCPGTLHLADSLEQGQYCLRFATFTSNRIVYCDRYIQLWSRDSAPTQQHNSTVYPPQKKQDILQLQWNKKRFFPREKLQVKLSSKQDLKQLQLRIIPIEDYLSTPPPQYLEQVLDSTIPLALHQGKIQGEVQLGEAPVENISVFLNSGAPRYQANNALAVTGTDVEGRFQFSLPLSNPPYYISTVFRGFTQSIPLENYSLNLADSALLQSLPNNLTKLNFPPERSLPKRQLYAQCQRTIPETTTTKIDFTSPYVTDRAFREERIELHLKQRHRQPSFLDSLQLSYLPNYLELQEIPADKQHRKTLCWSPNLPLTKGTQQLNFYLGDNTGIFLLELEGIDAQGQLFRQIDSFEVQPFILWTGQQLNTEKGDYVLELQFYNPQEKRQHIEVKFPKRLLSKPLKKRHNIGAKHSLTLTLYLKKEAPISQLLEQLQLRCKEQRLYPSTHSNN